MKNGRSMQGARIEALPAIPEAQWDATSKIYVNSEDAKVKDYVNRERSPPTFVNFFRYLNEGNFTPLDEHFQVFRWTV